MGFVCSEPRKSTARFFFDFFAHFKGTLLLLYHHFCFCFLQLFLLCFVFLFFFKINGIFDQISFLFVMKDFTFIQ